MAKELSDCVEDYRHITREEKYPSFEIEVSSLYEKTIEINGKKVIAVQREKDKGPFTVVPGYATDYKYKADIIPSVQAGLTHPQFPYKVVYYSKIKPVRNDQERKEIVKRLREEGFKGQINFW